MYGLYEKFAALIEIAVVCEIVKIFEILSKWRELFRLFRGSTPPKPAFQSVCGSVSVSVAVCLCALVDNHRMILCLLTVCLSLSKVMGDMSMPLHGSSSERDTSNILDVDGFSYFVVDRDVSTSKGDRRCDGKFLSNFFTVVDTQDEQEYTRMSIHMRDTRFSSSHVSANAIPLERLILCVLHCPMRTHEKVLTMLFQKACQHRMPNKSKEILDEMVVIIRRLGNLQDT